MIIGVPKEIKNNELGEVVKVPCITSSVFTSSLLI